MLRTKLAKKVLKRAQQKHLTLMGIHSMKHFLETRQHQLKQEQESSYPYRACFECRSIALKLDIED